jgi:class 3 adenylate cyclase/tetratricopeptide (TPR) repeat protein
MECPKCQTENPEGKKFCRECGANLALACPQCASEILPRDKFCGECGHNLTLPAEPAPKELSFEEKIDKIQRYLPRGLTDKILAQRDKIEGERKQVTVMFCDMEGFTSLAERLGPEDAYNIMDHVYEILIHKVHDYEGTVNEMTGDGIMALFGAPIALEDAPQRAIRSAYTIHREMAKFSDTIRQEKKEISPLKMRIGIHTGPVVVGTLGNDLRVEFKAVGDTVNVASRTEGLAEPGATYVTEATFRFTEGLFRFEALGEKKVKGKKEPIGVYRVIAPSTRRTRFDVSAERGLTPFVGRDRELELLVDGFERSKASKGQAFSIMSEAGVGKSRLLYEFRKAVANEDVTFLEGKCLSYSRGVAYHPFIDILRSNFDINEGDSDSKIRDKVKSGLNILLADEASTLPYLLELLFVTDSGLDKDLLTPEARRAGIMEALKRIVLRGSEIRPLILAFEDLHWIDKSSEDVLKDLLEHIPGARVLLIFTYRPEFALTWGGRSYHSQLNLNRLSNRESLAMVSHLLGTEDIENTLEEFILEKTEGVPFFIEEFTKSLKDLSIIEKDAKRYHLTKDAQHVTTPSTIQDVLLARVDSLPDRAKEVLQIGSVIEREFSYEIIKQLMALPEEELLSHLSVLKDSELLYERGIFPESVYVFKHALTREAVYSSLLIKRRTEIHEAIGKIIEELYPDRLEEFYETLAYHSFQGEDWERANNYNREAGLKAHAFSAYEKAQSYFEASLHALKKLPRTRDRVLQEIDLRFNMRAALFPLGRHDEWAEYVRATEPLAQEVGDKARLANCYNYLSTHLWTRGQHSEAIKLCEEGLSLAKSAGDFSVHITTVFHLAIPLLYTGEIERQVKLHREVAERLAGPKVFERYGLAGIPSVLARGLLSWGLAELGDFEEAEAWGSQGIEIAEQGKNLFSSTWAYACLGYAYLIHGKLDQSINMLEKALTLCREADVLAAFTFTAASFVHAQSLLGHPDHALPVLEEALRLQKASLSMVPSSYPLTALAEAFRLKGDTKKAIEKAEEALSIFRQKGERGFAAWAHYYVAKIKSEERSEQMEQAFHPYLQAREQAKQLGMRPLLAHCHMGLGQLYLKRGRSEEARPELTAALDLYRSMGMSFWVPQAESSLAKINS